jgi:hydroxypyruvate reductase
MKGTSPGNSSGRSAIAKDAMAIWQAGVNAVRPFPLVSQILSVEPGQLVVAAHRLRLDAIDRVLVVGAGKAVDGMAAAAVAALRAYPRGLSGWVNALASTGAQPAPSLGPVHRHVARTPGVNEPTPEAVHGTEEILKLVGALGPRDVCLCLLSGGGSAMLAAPPSGVTLEEKLAVIRRLSAAGASIAQLNAVRRCLSRVKGGQLAQQSGAGHLFTLVISDVLGDDIETIASGPTVIGSANPQAALDVLQQFTSDDWQPPAAVLTHLGHRAQQTAVADSASAATSGSHVHHILLANIQTAVEAAREEAQRRGYRTQTLPVEPDQPTADDAGAQLADALVSIPSDQPTCIISGGEPTVTLAAAAQRGRGGRNQQLALAALQRLAQRRAHVPAEFAFLSGGTDGEDGPTDAAGAVFGAELLTEADHDQESIEHCLLTNDAYSYFDSHRALLKTGPTGTNVCDLRVLLTS